MKKQVCSVKVNNFNDKETGQPKTMYQVFLIDDSGAVGHVYSTKPVKAGDFVELTIAAGRDGRFAVKVV